MTNKSRLILGAAAAVVVIGGVSIGLLLSQTSQPADLSTIHTTQAEPETMAPQTSAPAEDTSQALPEDAGTASSVTASLETYTTGNISIQYPVVSQMSDAQAQEQVNELLKDNALSVIEANDLDPQADTLTVKCQVISIDRRRITATYTGDLTTQGAAHPVSLFYSNTVDLTQIEDICLSDLADAYTMAGYVLSDDVTFLGLSPEELSAVLEYRSSLDLDTLTQIFENADFPLESGTWPESFSYERQGSICFSMPVPHALGDYVIVTYDPVTK